MAYYAETTTEPWQENATKSMNGKIADDRLLDTLITIFDFYVPCIVLSLGFIGNTLTFIVMTQRLRQRRNMVMSYHFRALAIGDNAVLVLGDSQRIILSGFPNAFKNYGDFICKEYNYILFVCFGVSVWNVVIISIDRFVAVGFPLKAALWCTLKKARILYAFNLCFHLAFPSRVSAVV
jgi:hypothetical protein